MGKCQSKSGTTVQTKNIDKVLQKDRHTQCNVVKILLLGAGESGKSTIFKQLKILHSEGFSEVDRQGYAAIIRKNVLESVRILLDGVLVLNMLLESELEEDAKVVHTLESEGGGSFTLYQAESLKRIWEHKLIQKVFEQRNRLQLADNAAHYLDKIDKIADPKYLPTDQDIVNSRVRSSGIVEMPLRIRDVDFRLMDVGGQRSERRKWIHCFDNVNAVLFVAAISEYDQSLYEDNSTNRLREALSLFEQICNSRFFTNTSMILFLNKRDIFGEKIKETDLNVCFPEYDGGKDCDVALKFLEGRFQDANKVPNKCIYTHVTCATDTTNVRFVFDAARDVIMMNALNGTGFM